MIFAIPDAPPALRSILHALPKNDTGLLIHQHDHFPKPDEWYAGIVVDGWGGGDIGPFPTAEQALIKGVHWLYSLYAECWKEAHEESEASI
jgi:hypothetical protein